MKAVVLAAGEGTRLRPLTEDKPKERVEVDRKPILTHCFEQLVELGADGLVVVVSPRKQDIIDHYGNEFVGVPTTYAHQREQKGLVHAFLNVEEHVDEDVMLMLGNNIFQANLDDVVCRQQKDRANADNATARGTLVRLRMSKSRRRRNNYLRNEKRVGKARYSEIERVVMANKALLKIDASNVGAVGIRSVDNIRVFEPVEGVWD